MSRGLDHYRARLERWLYLEAKATERPPHGERIAERQKIERVCAYWINHYTRELQRLEGETPGEAA